MRTSVVVPHGSPPFNHVYPFAYVAADILTGLCSCV